MEYPVEKWKKKRSAGGLRRDKTWARESAGIRRDFSDPIPVGASGRPRIAPGGGVSRQQRAGVMDACLDPGGRAASMRACLPCPGTCKGPVPMTRLTLFALLAALPLLGGCGTILIGGGAAVIADEVVENRTGGDGLF